MVWHFTKIQVAKQLIPPCFPLPQQFYDSTEFFYGKWYLIAKVPIPPLHACRCPYTQKLCHSSKFPRWERSFSGTTEMLWIPYCWKASGSESEWSDWDWEIGPILTWATGTGQSPTPLTVFWSLYLELKWKILVLCLNEWWFPRLIRRKYLTEMPLWLFKI